MKTPLNTSNKPILTRKINRNQRENTKGNTKGSTNGSTNGGTASFNIVINKRYLGGSLSRSLENNRIVSVLSPYGTGKTTAIKKYIKKMKAKKGNEESFRVLFITPRKSLNISIAGDFENINCYLDIKLEESNKNNQKTMIKSMSCTPQSLGALIDKLESGYYDLVVFDESETIAGMLISHVVKDKERTLNALKKVVSASNRIVFMDANYGADSKLLAFILSGNSEIPILENTFKPWANVGISVVGGTNFDERLEKINTLILKAVQAGEKIAIAASSATYATDIYKIINDSYPDLSIKLATSETDNQSLVNDPLSVIDIDVLIYSPSLSVGISFDLKDHFSTIFGVFRNVEKSPDSFDAMQQMCRVRSPKKWVIALDDDQCIYNNQGSSLTPNEIQKFIIRQQCENSIFAIGESAPLTTTQNQLIELYAVLEANKRYRKNNYNKIFMQLIHNMGMNVTIIDSEINTNIKESLTANKKEKKQKEKDALFSSLKITHEENEKLSNIRRYGGSLSKSEKLSMDRFYIEKSFDIDFDNLSPKERNQVLKEKDDGFVSKAKYRAQTSASKDFDKAYVKARIFGVDNDSQSYKKDAIDREQSYLLLKRLNSYALSYIDSDDGYTHKSLKRTAFYQWVIRNKREINIASPNFIEGYDFKKKPALLMNKLVKRIGYKISSRKDDKNIRTWRVKRNHRFEAFYSDQMSRGENWVEIIGKSLAELDVIKKTLTVEDINNLRMPLSHVNIVRKILDDIPAINHKSLMSEFKQSYDIMNPNNKHGINAQNIAIQALKKQAENIKKSSNFLHQKFDAKKTRENVLVRQ